MFDIQQEQDNLIQQFIVEPNYDYFIQLRTPEEKAVLLILRDLMRLGWEITYKSEKIIITPPLSYDKQIIKDSMEIKRQEQIFRNQTWIDDHIELARQNLEDGNEVWQSEIIPEIEVCTTKLQKDTFRIFRYYWSSPYSEYVGRRIRLLIRDNGLPSRPVIGIAALGSSIVHIPSRDNWIGWDKKTRTNNLIYTMDAYVLGALPPYNHLLGGKLVSYLIASNEVRSIFREKYANVVTNINQRSANDLACIFTTSLYGKSSQYNRIKYHEETIYSQIGMTKGFGTLHLTDETFEAMRELLEYKNIQVTNRFGDGPIWRMRVIRTAAGLLGFDANVLLQHSFQRAVYVIPLATNYKDFLNGRSQNLDYHDYQCKDLVEYWRNRWLNPRKQRQEIEQAVVNFRKSDFNIC